MPETDQYRRDLKLRELNSRATGIIKDVRLQDIFHDKTTGKVELIHDNGETDDVKALLGGEIDYRVWAAIVKPRPERPRGGVVGPFYVVKSIASVLPQVRIEADLDLQFHNFYQ